MSSIFFFQLAGVVIPNDGQCHLDSNDEYDKSTEQDYPSIAQIHKTVIEHKVRTARQRKIRILQFDFFQISHSFPRNQGQNSNLPPSIRADDQGQSIENSHSIAATATLFA